MGAAESKAQGNGTGASPAGEGVSSKAKLTFAQGTPPLQTTSVYTLRDAYFGNRAVSAFAYDPAQFVLDNKQEFLPKAIKKLKTIRHPSVLRFIDCKTSSAGVHLITEQVVPLTVEYLKDITEDEILVGLFDIMVALHFLHSQCHASHNNVQLGSIFVSNGRWVLGGMEFTGTAAESTESGLTSLLSKELVPPEYQGQGAHMASGHANLPHAVDIWQYGKLIEILIQDGLLHAKLNALPLDRMLNSDPRKRPSGDVILESDLFMRNNAVSVVRYCRLKGLDKIQNAEWSQTIMPKLHMLPPSIMEKIVLPQLLTQEFFSAEGFDELYRTLFTPQPSRPLVREEIYRSQVMPFMIKLWTYRQADIRMTILRLFEVYLKAVVLGEGGSEVLGQIILPEVLAGLQDADSKVYSASLCGLATAIPYALLVTTLVDTDLTKQKYSVKSLYEQTLIPQIMAFWISEDCNQESRVQLVEVVMGMWCSIYSLGLHNHAAVKDMSATLTLTLVSVLKLSSVNERVELITKSFTKHCTNSIFCISGLLKFLPQFLLDEDAQVREAAARAISAVAFQTITLASNSDMAGESQDQQQEVDANGQPSLPAPSTPSVASSPSSTSSAHISRIRQYCEKQQSLLPPRRPIFSRSAFASERSMSGTSLKQFNGSSSHSTLDLQSSSRRSSMVSQDSYMMSEQGSLKTTPSLFTPSLTRAGSFSGDVVLTNKDSHSGLGFQASGNGLDTQLSAHVDKSPRSQESRQDAHFKAAQKTTGDFDIKAEADAHVDLEEESTNVPEEDSQSAAELELIKALEAAKAEMRARQLPLDRHTNTNPRSITRGPDSKLNNAIQGSATFGWDDAEDDEGDDWGNEDSATLNSSALQSPSSVLEQPIEDEATRRKREQEKAYKQEQLRLKRDQKQQEMQAKREARRQQLAEKQVQKKGSSNALKLGAVKTTTPGSSAPTSASKSAPPLSTLTAVSKPASGRSMIPADDEDSWDVEDGLDLLSALDQKQAGRAGTMELKDEDDELFKDLEVTYMKPAYVGGVSSAPAPVVSGLISNTPSPTLIKSSPKTLTSPVKSIHSPVSSASNFASGTGVATAAAVAPAPPASTGSLSLKPVNSPAHSRESSPVSTPKRVASPLLRTGTTGSNGSLSSINGNNKIHGNGVSATTPDTASETAVSNSPLTTTSSLALQVDEATLEEDGWGDDWQ